VNKKQDIEYNAHDYNKKEDIAYNAYKHLGLEFPIWEVTLDLDWDNDEGEIATEDEIENDMLDMGYRIKVIEQDPEYPEYVLYGPREDLEDYIKTKYTVDSEDAKFYLSELKPAIYSLGKKYTKHFITGD
jgi:hypothetical protein